MKMRMVHAFRVVAFAFSLLLLAHLVNAERFGFDFATDFSESLAITV